MHICFEIIHITSFNKTETNYCLRFRIGTISISTTETYFSKHLFLFDTDEYSCRVDFLFMNIYYKDKTVVSSKQRIKDILQEMEDISDKITVKENLLYNREDN
jgi:hypothetical protein